MMSPNRGDRPSLLQLGRYAAGELDEQARHKLESELDADARRVLSEMEAARSSMPALDVASLRARAAALPAQPVPLPANNTWGFRAWMPALALAAALLLTFWLWPDPQVRYRPGDLLNLYHLGPQGGVPYAQGTPLGEDDMLGFEVVAGGHHGVVVLSVDGNGAVSVFYPRSGEEPEPISGDGRVKLPGSVILDGAPGPEVFLALFDVSVDEARRQVQHTYQSGGHEGLLDWAATAPSVDAVPVTRR
jgi:hypothetical protein